MWTSFKYSLLQIIRVPGILIWTLIFPIVLGSLFVLMLGSLDDRAETTSIKVAVVEDDQAFNAFVKALSEGDDALFDVTYAESPAEAADLVRNSLGTNDEYAGYIYYDDGAVQTVLSKATNAAEAYEVEPSILMMVMDRYAAEEALIKNIMINNPSAFANPDFMESITDPIKATVRTSVTENQPRESLHYYFALFGMAAFFGSNIGLVGFLQIRANTSTLAARRSLGTLSHAKTAFVTLLASWLLSFVSLLILFAYLVFVGNVDFGNRSGICILICLIASLCATAFGCAMSAIPKIPDQAKAGLISGIVCLASLFAGLYGTFAMDFANMVSQNAPWLDIINPIVQVCQAFYATMFYDTYAQTYGHLVILLIMTLIFFAVSARSLRRQRYASL